ncbi:hypothetical protein HDU93_002323 [Gonapodya sp. JEL0774]|nr:hypothetical protein HDU93_002323 [Gonapodya sp. JEL0774]
MQGTVPRSTSKGDEGPTNERWGAWRSVEKDVEDRSEKGRRGAGEEEINGVSSSSSTVKSMGAEAEKELSSSTSTGSTEVKESRSRWRFGGRGGTEDVGFGLDFGRCIWRKLCSAERFAEKAGGWNEFERKGSVGTDEAG